MLFYYAYSGHKNGLERVRRGAALMNALHAKGKEAVLLVNDFRAGLAAKELGVKEYVTVESVQDIDAIAQTGDSIIIDSLEDDHGRLVKYCSDFKQVWRFAHSLDDHSIHGETLLRAECKEEASVDALIVDKTYFDVQEKEERVLFFLGDSDYDKVILNHASFFKSFDMELLLGNYFFVKYEDDLAKLFSQLHEPEEYETLIQSSTTVVTSSSQTALEACITGAKVVYIDFFEETIYPTALLHTFGIESVKGFNVEALQKLLNKPADQDVTECQEKLAAISEKLVQHIS